MRRHTDHFFAIETEGAGIQRDTQGYIGIHVYPGMYPGVSPRTDTQGYIGTYRVSRMYPGDPLTQIHRDSIGISKDDVLFFGRDSAGLALFLLERE